jgi:ParB/RepB/Spo0J family partition protein
MSQPAIPEINLEKVVIEDEFNARSDMDQGALARLGASIKKNGLIQPITVRPMSGGKFKLLAGERRIRAAQLEGIKKLPAKILQGGNDRVVNLAENLHREDLNEIEKARGVKALAEELKLGTHKAIAAEVGFSAAWVSGHLRLLDLPDSIQALIASGHIPSKAERLLRPIVKVSPRNAEFVCELAKRDGVEPGEFTRVFPDLLAAVPHKKFTDPPTMIPSGGDSPEPDRLRCKAGSRPGRSLSRGSAVGPHRRPDARLQQR